MKLSSREIEKTNLCNLGVIAQRKLACGNRLSAPDAIALLSAQVMYFARKGVSVSKLMSLGTTLLGRNQVIPGVESMVESVQVEAQFPDGTKLVTLHDPISSLNGNLKLALEGSFLPVPDVSLFTAHSEEGLIPGELIPLVGTDVTINKGRDVVNITVTNTADRPIQVGSHYHFIETNPYLEFDRSLAYGMRLNICAGASVRFEPGASLMVSLVSIAGKKVVRGGNALCNGPVSDDPAVKAAVLTKLLAEGFKHKVEPGVKVQSNYAGLSVDRSVYAHAFGPTTGDVIRLGDTELYIRVEKDHTVYGDECVFGGGKVIREGMGQATGLSPAEQLDTVMTNALIVDHSGIFKADIGIKAGRIVGIGKAGNPDVMEGVDEGMVVGVNTEVIAAEGMIVTAGGIDTHVHFICPQLVEEALCSGLTTLVGGGTGPATGTCATTCTPGPFHIQMMMEATDQLPMNFGFTGKGNTSDPKGLHEIVRAGAVGLKLHEDWGTTPAAIDNCLSVADAEDVQVTIHTDTLNESSCVEKTIATFKGRTIHSYHTEGAGGGHAPDIITVVGQPNVIPSSTNPTRPFTVNTLDEHLDMLMVCHHLDKNIPNDVAFAESRIRAETMAAEDILHDMGAISIISSDSQAMGRIGEVLTRTWQTADKMKRQRGQLTEDKQADTAFNASHPSSGRTILTDNFRVRRYVAKCTINPAIAHGLASEVGSVEKGKLADLVLWKPAYFGAKPEIIVKGGHIAYAQMGDPNASIPTTEPVMMRPMFGALGRAASHSSLLFVSRSCLDSGVGEGYKLLKPLRAVNNTRGIGKRDMVLNECMPNIKVDPETYKVTVDEVVLTCEPAVTVPLSTRYFMI